MYIVIELQTNADGTLGNIVNKYDSIRDAESKYYSILSAAALSKLPVHSAVILDNTGMSHAARSYTNSKEESHEE